MIINKFSLLIILLVNEFYNLILFSSANSSEETLRDSLIFTLGEVESRIVQHNIQSKALLKIFGNKIDDLDKKITLSGAHNYQSLCNNNQQCCIKTENETKEIENIQMKIIESENNIIAMLTNNSNIHKAVLDEILKKETSLETINQEQLDDIKSVKKDLLNFISKFDKIKQKLGETFQKIKNVEMNEATHFQNIKQAIHMISNYVINLNNRDITSDIQKIVTESNKNVLKDINSKFDEIVTILNKVNQIDIYSSLQNFNKDLNNLISKISVDNENNKKMFDELSTKIDVIKQNFAHQTNKPTSNDCVVQGIQENDIRSVVNETLVMVKTIEHDFNKFVVENYKRPKDELDEFGAKINDVMAELRKIKLQNKVILQHLQNKHPPNSESVGFGSDFHGGSGDSP